MKKYFLKIEIYPAVQNDRKSISGSIVFKFDSRLTIVRTANGSCDLKIQDGRESGVLTENYHPVELLIEITDKEYHEGFSPHIPIEKICDIVSVSTKCPWSYISSRIHEYENYHLWQYAEGENIPNNAGLLKEPGNYFVEADAPGWIISAINGHRYRDRIFSAIHLMRLSKYKRSTHSTEALTDCVNALEALYMKECNETGFQSKIDEEVVNIDGKNKAKALKWFIEKYYPADKNDIDFDFENIYKIRSAYLHRGKLVEKVSGYVHWKLSREETEDIRTVELFCDISFLTLLSFIVPIQMTISLKELINQSEEN